MTDTQKLTTIKALLEDGSGYMPADTVLNTYITLSQNEILAWMYHLVGGVPDDVTEVPSKYESVQIYAVIAGWTHAGAEGQDEFRRRAPPVYHPLRRQDPCDTGRTYL